MLPRQAIVFGLSCASMMGVLAFMACNDDATPNPVVLDSGATADSAPDLDVTVTVTSDAQSKQIGTIIQAQTTDQGVGDASVSIADGAVFTNANGQYQIIVPRNTPYQMIVAADGFYKLHEQEYFVTIDTLDRGVTNLLASSTADFLASLLPGRDNTKGLLLVKVNPRPPCVTEEGSTITIDPAGNSKLSYFSGPLPSSAQLSTKGGTDFSAVFYNVDVGVPIKVLVTSPSCKQVAFPVVVGDVTYTGEHATVEGGESLTYVRTYIQDPVGAADAGN
jgi:hypothetical protein